MKEKQSLGGRRPGSGAELRSPTPGAGDNADTLETAGY